jgi:hypothetical protein
VISNLTLTTPHIFTFSILRSLILRHLRYSLQPKTQGLTVEKWAAVIDMPTVHKTVDTFDALVMNSH